MNIKKYIYIIFALIGCMILFTGCMPDIPMTIKGEELPADSKMFVLLRPVEEKQQKLYIPDDIKGTELEGYNRDGWVPAAYVDYVYERHDIDETILKISYEHGASNDDIMRFCQKYKEVRFAVMNKKGNILYVTDVLDLTPSDIFGYPKDVTYSARTGKFTTDNTVEKKICGKTLTGWWLMLSLLSWITDIALLVLLRKALKNCDRNYLIQNRIPIILLALPSIIELIMGIVINTMPYFYGKGGITGLVNSLESFAVLNIIFMADVMFLPIAVKRSK